MIALHIDATSEFQVMTAYADRFLLYPRYFNHTDLHGERSSKQFHSKNHLNTFPSFGAERLRNLAARRTRNPSSAKREDEASMKLKAAGNLSQSQP